MSSDPNVSLPTSSSIGFLPLYPDSPRDLEPSVHGSLPSSSHSPASSIPANVGTSYITGSGTQRGAVASTAAPDVLDHLYKGAQCAADVKALVQSAQESFRLIEDWFEGESASRHPKVVSVKGDVNKVYKAYPKGVKASVKVAEHGIVFAADIATLFECLSEDPGADLGLFVDEMRKIAGLAHKDAKDTYDTFSAGRQTLNQIIKRISPVIAPDDSQDPNLQGEGDMTGSIFALKLLNQVDDDLHRVLDSINKFANWWTDAETMITTCNSRVVIVNRQQMSLLRINSVRNEWEIVRERYEIYKKDVGNLQDLYPIDKMRTSSPWINKIFVRRPAGAQ